MNTLGLMAWQARPGYFSKSAPAAEPSTSPQSSGPGFEATAVDAPENLGVGMGATSDLVQNEAPLSVTKVAFVLVGAGLDDVWQNEASVQWALMLNILKAFQLSEEPLRFFDTAHAVTDDAVFASIEEVIDLGVETVFAFEENSPLIEQLEEGLQVVFLPSLDEMLQRPQAKRETFEILSHVMSA